MKRLLLTALLICCINLAYSCTCVMYPIETEVESAVSVVTVKVVEQLHDENNDESFLYPKWQNSYRVKVKIIRNFKGEPQADELIELYSFYNNCYPNFTIGDEYLLFLDKKENEYLYRACSYSGRFADSKKKIKKIEKLLKKRR